ncbi:MAG: hypothetical protein ACN4GR_06980, partial [Arenicellales bacterium]
VSIVRPKDPRSIKRIDGLSVAYKTCGRIILDATCDEALVRSEISRICSSFIDQDITKFEITHYAC